ncbi:type II toxin-antitoxin system mRNA interferase toxin, RelE/StbE family [Campylobacter sp. MIT 97-5078]|uniref:type II toxin-antitoxin system mRNA interferase toxin, RelE/StbE family n=1 Tax=Campylobacter sp. MIT 97-5078 TaxID=1548153 RepID=UPI001E4C0CE7|nr:type II toxin-antitoxin system mRNA interferase toxin, RelE/StbE family [Campylobacter sp. MIT 97-5078]
MQVQNKQYKKLSLEFIKKLLSGAVLEPKYKKYKLKGKYKCHIKPNLLLIYQKQIIS